MKINIHFVAFYVYRFNILTKYIYDVKMLTEVNKGDKYDI